MESYTKAKVSTFQERFTELCASKSSTDSNLADKLGVSKQTISSWKSGHRSPKKPMIQAIANHFGVTVDWLMGFDVPKRASTKRMYAHDSSPFHRRISPSVYNILKAKGKTSESPNFRISQRGFDMPTMTMEVPEKAHLNDRAEKMLKVIGQIAKEDPHSAADLLTVLVERDML